MTLQECINLSDHQDGLQLLYEHILDKAKAIPEMIPFVEIGTRTGGTALLTLLAIKESGVSRPLFTIDPYGNKPYNRNDEIIDLDYGEQFYRLAILKIAEFCNINNLLHHHWRLLSEDFIKIYDEVNIWYNGKVLDSSTFGFVYLDGEHAENCLIEELSWFLPRLHCQGSLVIDDAECIVGSSNQYLKDLVSKASNWVNSRLYLTKEIYQ